MLSAESFLNAASLAIIAVGGRERGRRISGGEVFDLGQAVFGIVRVLGKVAGGEQRLAREIPVVIVLITVRRVRRELVARIHDAAIGCPVAHRIVGERLRGGLPGW